MRVQAATTLDGTSCSATPSAGPSCGCGSWSSTAGGTGAGRGQYGRWGVGATVLDQAAAVGAGAVRQVRIATACTAHGRFYQPAEWMPNSITTKSV